MKKKDGNTQGNFGVFLKFSTKTFAVIAQVC